jgi:hypothetical protein
VDLADGKARRTLCEVDFSARAAVGIRKSRLSTSGPLLSKRISWSGMPRSTIRRVSSSNRRKLQFRHAPLMHRCTLRPAPYPTSSETALAPRFKRWTVRLSDNNYQTVFLMGHFLPIARKYLSAASASAEENMSDKWMHR